MEGFSELQSTILVLNLASKIRLDEHGSSLKVRFGGPSPLFIWAQLHELGSNLAVCLRAGPGLLGTVAWGTRVGLEPGRFVPLPRDFRGWPILALELLNRDFSLLGMAT